MIDIEPNGSLDVSARDDPWPLLVVWDKEDSRLMSVWTEFRPVALQRRWELKRRTPISAIAFWQEKSPVSNDDGRWPTEKDRRLYDSDTHSLIEY